MPIKAIFTSQNREVIDRDLLPCPFCGAPGQIIEDEDDIIRDICPSGIGVMCTGDCWIGGTIVDYDAWQSREKEK